MSIVYSPSSHSAYVRTYVWAVGGGPAYDLHSRLGLVLVLVLDLGLDLRPCTPIEALFNRSFVTLPAIAAACQPVMQHTRCML
jgi:hypothetical protein